MGVTSKNSCDLYGEGYPHLIYYDWIVLKEASLLTEKNNASKDQ